MVGRALVVARRARPRRRGDLGGRPTARHGRARRRAAGAASRQALERHRVGPAGRRARARVGPVGVGRCRRLGPGGVVHDHQARVAARARARRVRTRRARAAPPRLADAAAQRRARDRSRRRVGHRVLVAVDRVLRRRRVRARRARSRRSRRRCSSRARVAGTRGDAVVGRRHRRQHGRRARPRAAGRRRRDLARHVGHRLRGRGLADAATRPARWRASPTPPVASCPSCAR